jgi:phosphoribosylaminoimidazole (AIR) synthetase
MILVVPETQAEEIANAASTNGYPASVIGKIAIMRAGETQAVVLE